MNFFERTPGESLAGDRRIQAIAVVAVLSLAVVPFTTTASLTGIMLKGLVFVMLGVSWNLLAGYAGQVSLGHAMFFGMGAFIAAWLSTPDEAGLPAAIGLPLLVAIPLAALAAALIALVVGPIIFRLRGHYFAIGTLALATVVELLMLDNRWLTGGSTGYYVDGDLGLGAGITHGDVMYLLTLLATIATIYVTYRIVVGRGGLGMRSIHDDEEAASSLGVNPLKYKMYAFVVSSFFAGLAGALYAHYTLFISSSETLGVGWTIDTLVVVILGGMGTFVGPLLGAGLFLILDNGLTTIIGDLATTVEGALIILFIVFLPQGLYGLVDINFVREATNAEAVAAGDAAESGPMREDDAPRDGED